MAIIIDDSFTSIDWARVKADLAADDFDNGRSPDALRLAFERSQHVAFARDQHIGLQTDDAQELYGKLGFRAQPEFLSLVVGQWLDNDANRDELGPSTGGSEQS
jgi:hypothetical protein